MPWEVLDTGGPLSLDGVRIAIKSRQWGQAAHPTPYIEIVLGRECYQRLGLLADPETQQVSGKCHIAWGTGPQEGMIRIVPIKGTIPGIEISSTRQGAEVKIRSRKMPSSRVEGFLCELHEPEFDYGDGDHGPFIEIHMPDGFFPEKAEATTQLATIPELEAEARLRITAFRVVEDGNVRRYEVGKVPDVDKHSTESILRIVNSRRQAANLKPLVLR